jgi:triosephosphate isomerase
MTRFIVANWKSHKTLSQAEMWLETFCRLHRANPRLQIILAPPAIYLAPLNQLLDKKQVSNIYLAIQDVSPFPFGSYTGAIAADMLHGMAEYAIIGHSERRRYFHETHQEIANKATEAILAEIKPILCVDQPYARSQIAAIDEKLLSKLIIGYGPVEVAGLDVPQETEKIRAVVKEIHEIVPDSPILYGGSINSSNVADIVKIEGVSGLMMGSACLEASVFADICNIASSSP